MRVLCSLRHNANTQFRNLAVEAKDPDFTQVAMEVSKITRMRPGGSRLFSPTILPLISLTLEAKACKSAKMFLKLTGFTPNRLHWDVILGVFLNGLVEEAMDVFAKLKMMECVCRLRLGIWLCCCLRIKRTDLFWQLYQEMIECGVSGDVKTVEYLIHAFCDENQISKAYELVRQVLEDGLAPKNASFNKLVSGFSKEKNYERVSELLHMMIATNRNPDVYTYQEVINGLCKNRKVLEGFRVLMTSRIEGMLQIGVGEFGKGRELYKEMCDKGFGDNVVSYNIMIVLLCSEGSVSEADQMFKEMAKKGIIPDLSTYNCLIKGFCKEGKIEESIELLNQLIKDALDEMIKAGLEPRIDTLDAFAVGYCDVGDVEGMEWLVEMLRIS
ncbi:hypothetical protein G4B88_015070 [Cannabis sativa]|uniref:Pentatricopeptide repeat-containing protein n=1 Tax=Cannabis sativa TaxID=3483 RepID=A0A7J6ELX2_CANSA|nr:hypothetical protein G4B88_015070 [Cannabis sativa]